MSVGYMVMGLMYSGKCLHIEEYLYMNVKVKEYIIETDDGIFKIVYNDGNCVGVFRIKPEIKMIHRG